MVPIFKGRVDDKGVLVLDRPLDFARLKAKLRGKFVEVILRRRSTQRSVKQNAFLHGVALPILCEHFGNTVAKMKLDLLGEKWGYERSPVTGREVPIKQHTSELTTAEFAELVDWIPMWAMSEHNCFVPLPNEVEL